MIPKYYPSRKDHAQRQQANLISPPVSLILSITTVLRAEVMTG